MKRGWTLLLAIALIFGVLALPAGAQEIEVTDEATFAQALYDGGTLILQNDIYISDFVLVRENVTIDLNGYQILVAEGANGANIRHTNGCEMVIRDSVGTGKIGGGEKRVFLNMECGSLRIEGGFVDRLLISGGDAELVSGTIDVLEFNSLENTLLQYAHEN